jgi:hypothetical protein
MITGRVPFDGESAGEILMKHLTATPDLSKLPAGYVQVLQKALEKNPAYRFGTFGEMAQAVEQIGAPPQAIPDVLPAGEGEHRGGGPARSEPRPRPSPPPMAQPAPISFRTRLSEMCASMVLAGILSLLFAILWTAGDHALGGKPGFAEFGGLLYLLVLTCWAVLIPGKLWDQRRGDGWVRRSILLLLGLGLGAAAAYLNGWPFEKAAEEAVAVNAFSIGDVAISTKMFGFLAYFGVAFFALRWWKLAERTRARRFGLFPVLVTACVALILAPLWPDFGVADFPVPIEGPLVLTLASVIVQLVSPWEEPATRPARRLRLRYA